MTRGRERRHLDRGPAGPPRRPFGRCTSATCAIPTATSSAPSTAPLHSHPPSVEKPLRLVCRRAKGTATLVAHEPSRSNSSRPPPRWARPAPGAGPAQRRAAGASGATSSRKASPQAIPRPTASSCGPGGPSTTASASMLTVEVAEDEAFRRVVARRGTGHRQRPTGPARVLVGGLKPARIYWYRFTDADGNGSRIGRTRHRAAPDDPRPVNFAFVSCQNINEGKLNAYRRMIFEDERARPADQLGFVLHLGDFIYEVVQYPEEGRPATTARSTRSRAFPTAGRPAISTIPLTVDGYRAVYKGYLADPDLQDARARWPFVCIWDNHEFSWQGRQSIVQAGGPPQPGQTVKVAANQAWFEYIPARVSPPSGSLAEFGPVAVKNVKIEKLGRERAWARSRTTCRDPQPDRLSRAPLRQAPRPPHYRPAQLLRRRSDRRRRGRKDLRPGIRRLCSPRKAMIALDAGRAFNGGKPPAELQFRDVTHSESAQGQAAADHPRRRAEGLVQGPAAQVEGDLEDLGQFARRSRPSRRPAKPARRNGRRIRGRRTRYGMAAATISAPPTPSASEIYDLVATRRSPASPSSRATGTASGPAMPPPASRRGNSSRSA